MGRRKGVAQPRPEYPYIVKFKLKNGITTEKKYESRRDRDEEYRYRLSSGECEWVEKTDLR